jgi:hypothetical protein
MSLSYHCPACLNRDRVIHYSARQELCAICGHSPLALSPAEEDVSLPTAIEILHDPASSTWLKQALASALCRDPVDAANDAEVLASVLNIYCRQLLDKR